MSVNQGSIRQASEISVPLKGIAVTVYNNVYDNVGERHTLVKCLNSIRADAKLARMVADLRPLYSRAEETAADADKEAYAKAKKELPAFTISGAFTKRSVTGLEKYTGIIQADFDHLRDCVKSHLASLRSMILEAWARIIASLEEGLVS